MFVLRYFVFFLFMHAALYAVPYEHHVDEILNQGHTLKLEDGSYWEIKEGFEEVQKWQTGDVIALECRFTLLNNRDWYFKNLRMETSAHFSLLLDAQLPETSLYTVEAGKKNSYVRLNDQSIWSCCFFSCPFTHCDLNIQDRVIIFKASDGDGYYLIKWNSQSVNLNKDIQYATLNFNQEEAPYRHFISKILLDENSGKYQIQLDNGFVWNWVPPLFNSSYEWVKEWQVGDEVCLNYEAQKQSTRDNPAYIYFFVIHLQSLHQIRVNYSEEKEGAYYKIEGITLHKNSIFHTYATLVLNDGSSWEVTDSSIKQWRVGDSVLISSDITSAYTEQEFILINPTCGLTPSFFGLSSLRLHSGIHAKKLACVQ